MTIEVHIDSKGGTHRVGRLYADKRATVSFQYENDWISGGGFPIDPTSPPLSVVMYRATTLFGA
jgi:hypothetical protein